jgi:hypothetical protein
MEKEPGFCTKCGAIRIKTVEMLNRYNPVTGVQLSTTWLVCPQYRRTILWLSNGHNRWIA